MKKQLLCVLCLVAGYCGWSQSWQWGKRGGSGENISTNYYNRIEEVYSLATDSQKNIYALSKVGLAGLNFDGNPDSGYTGGSNISEVALVSFACDGTFRWSKILGGGSFEYFPTVVVDQQDNVYLGGSFENNSLTYPQHIDDDQDFAGQPIDYRSLTLIKFNSMGELQWFERPQQAGISAADSFFSVTRGFQIDAEGNLHWLAYLMPGVYANGAFVKEDDGQFWHVLKYDPDGNFLQAVPLEFQASNGIAAIQFTLNKATGQYFLSAGALTEGDTGWATVGSQQVMHSMFLSCFSATGQSLWIHENNTTFLGGVSVFEPTFDADNNIYLGGSIVGSDLLDESFMGFSVPGIILPGFLMKIDPTGSNVIWATHHNRTGSGKGATALSGGELGYTSVCLGEDFTWGGQTLNASGPNELFEVLFARFDTETGACTSLMKIPGNPGFNDGGTALAVDASGDYIVGGNFSGTLTFDGGAQVTSLGGQSDFFVAKFATAPCVPMGVDDNTLQQIRLYPNPANTQIAINVSERTGFKIYGVTGQLLMHGSIYPEQPIDVTGLAVGFYVVKLQGKQGDTNLKFFKE